MTEDDVQRGRQKAKDTEVGGKERDDKTKVGGGGAHFNETKIRRL